MKGGSLVKKIVFSLAAIVLVIGAGVPSGRGLLSVRKAAAEPAASPAKPAAQTVRLEADGKVLIAESLRKQAGITPGAELELEWNGREIVLRKRVTMTMQKTASGLQYEDVVVGQGAAPKAG